MKGLSLSLVLILTTMVYIDTVNGQTCTQDTITNCTKPIEPYYYIGNWTTTGLNNACSMVDNISTCVSNLGCAENDQSYRLEWEGEKDASTYVCGRRWDVLSKVRCWNSSNVTNAEDYYCYDDFYSTVEDNPNALCRAVNYLLSCINVVVAYYCGSGSANIYVTYLYKLNKPNFEIMWNCSLDNPGVPRTTGRSVVTTNTGRPMRTTRAGHVMTTSTGRPMRTTSARRSTKSMSTPRSDWAEITPGSTDSRRSITLINGGTGMDFVTTTSSVPTAKTTTVRSDQFESSQIPVGNSADSLMSTLIIALPIGFGALLLFAVMLCCYGIIKCYFVRKYNKPSTYPYITHGNGLRNANALGGTKMAFYKGDFVQYGPKNINSENTGF